MAHMMGLGNQSESWKIIILSEKFTNYYYYHILYAQTMISFYCLGRIECVDILFKSGADIACKDKKVFSFFCDSRI